ncbi:MAG: peptide chain release factor N(5)-glutamine methyltransferase [Candidatus Eisenbacteria bacterium]|nr:peptide chain release factor N(5)-glutamine methyltransferase [Candidatus Eisenbacteria bacterium]
MSVDSGGFPNPLFLWIRGAASRIESIGAGNPRLEAEYLMAAALGVPRIRLWLLDRPPAPDAVARFEALLERRMSREPLQYVLGTAEFAGLTLDVGPGVFIPRSETEILVERVETRLRARMGGCGAAPRILDVGTGSGAILLALMERFAEATGVGIDQSPDALVWARRNAVRLGLDDRVRFLEGDLLDPIGPDERFDAIVSNPPYVSGQEMKGLASEIRDHEPAAALEGGEDGLDVVQRLIPQAAARLSPGGLLALEIGITQGEAVRSLLGGGSFRSVEILPDLAGRPRVALVERSQ